MSSLFILPQVTGQLQDALIADPLQEYFKFCFQKGMHRYFSGLLCFCAVFFEGGDEAGLQLADQYEPILKRAGVFPL